MSIMTKTGDGGSTGLMYNRRVSKCHPRVEAYGAVDELNAALGMTRATAAAGTGARLEKVQRELIGLMGELAVLPEDAERYAKDGYAMLSAEMVAQLETWAREAEAAALPLKGWATPGATVHAAALDVARTVCRRAELHVWSLKEAGALRNEHIPIYLNRLSDLLWLLARLEEQEQQKKMR